MSVAIPTITESARGCGYRKPGGYYLRLDEGITIQCGALPIPLVACECCGEGVKPSRAPSWKQARFFKRKCELSYCRCEMRNTGINSLPDDEPILLVWIGKKHYPTKEQFIKETHSMGISRRLNAVPRDFKIGETWVMLAMQDVPIPGKYDENGEPVTQHEAFFFFKPDRIEYVCHDEDSEKAESEEFIDNLHNRGIQPIRVKRDVEARHEVTLFED